MTITAEFIQAKFLKKTCRPWNIVSISINKYLLFWWLCCMIIRICSTFLKTDFFFPWRWSFSPILIGKHLLSYRTPFTAEIGPLPFPSFRQFCHLPKSLNTTLKTCILLKEIRSIRLYIFQADWHSNLQVYRRHRASLKPWLLLR